MNALKAVWVVSATLSLVACSEDTTPPTVTTEIIDMASISLAPTPGTGRWYTDSEVREGKEIFATHCASCHGKNAEATPDWKSLDANSNYPPPPLNGTAHAWHHPLSVLKLVIEQGGEPMGGQMPAWGDVLTDQEIVKVIASFQSYWPDKVYSAWLEREQANRGQ
jgi:mono/diheme cytochrome c family protein